MNWLENGDWILLDVVLLAIMVFLIWYLFAIDISLPLSSHSARDITGEIRYSFFVLFNLSRSRSVCLLYSLVWFTAYFSFIKRTDTHTKDETKLNPKKYRFNVPIVSICVCSSWLPCNELGTWIILLLFNIFF